MTLEHAPIINMLESAGSRVYFNTNNRSPRKHSATATHMVPKTRNIHLDQQQYARRPLFGELDPVISLVLLSVLACRVPRACGEQESYDLHR
jgi:hypothetical protein